MIDEVNVCCPYCGETIATTVDCSGGSAQYIEDCFVCCQPIKFDLRVSIDGDIEQLIVQREND